MRSSAGRRCRAVIWSRDSACGSRCDETMAQALRCSGSIGLRRVRGWRLYQAAGCQAWHPPREHASTAARSQLQIRATTRAADSPVARSAGRSAMRLWLAKVQGRNRAGLIATDAAGQAMLAKMSDGECAEFEMRRVRSLPWHRKYFGICRQIGQNQEPPRDEDSIDHELRILAGHYEVMKLRDPKSGTLYEVLTPKRIAFNKLTQDEWSELYPSLE